MSAIFYMLKVRIQSFGLIDYVSRNERYLLLVVDVIVTISITVNHGLQEYNKTEIITLA